MPAHKPFKASRRQLSKNKAADATPGDDLKHRYPGASAPEISLGGDADGGVAPQTDRAEAIVQATRLDLTADDAGDADFGIESSAVSAADVNSLYNQISNMLADPAQRARYQQEYEAVISDPALRARLAALDGNTSADTFTDTINEAAKQIEQYYYGQQDAPTLESAIDETPSYHQTVLNAIHSKLRDRSVPGFQLADYQQDVRAILGRLPEDQTIMQSVRRLPQALRKQLAHTIYAIPNPDNGSETQYVFNEDGHVCASVFYNDKTGVPVCTYYNSYGERESKETIELVERIESLYAGGQPLCPHVVYSTEDQQHNQREHANKLEANRKYFEKIKATLVHEGARTDNNQRRMLIPHLLTSVRKPNELNGSGVLRHELVKLGHLKSPPLMKDILKTLMGRTRTIIGEVFGILLLYILKALMSSLGLAAVADIKIEKFMSFVNTPKVSDEDKKTLERAFLKVFGKEIDSDGRLVDVNKQHPLSKHERHILHKYWRKYTTSLTLAERREYREQRRLFRDTVEKDFGKASTYFGQKYQNKHGDDQTHRQDYKNAEDQRIDFLDRNEATRLREEAEAKQTIALNQAKNHVIDVPASGRFAAVSDNVRDIHTQRACDPSISLTEQEADDILEDDQHLHNLSDEAHFNRQQSTSTTSFSGRMRSKLAGVSKRQAFRNLVENLYTAMTGLEADADTIYDLMHNASLGHETGDPQPQSLYEFGKTFDLANLTPEAITALEDHMLAAIEATSDETSHDQQSPTLQQRMTSNKANLARAEHALEALLDEHPFVVASDEIDGDAIHAADAAHFEQYEQLQQTVHQLQQQRTKLRNTLRLISTELAEETLSEHADNTNFAHSAHLTKDRDGNWVVQFDETIPAAENIDTREIRAEAVAIASSLNELENQLESAAEAAINADWEKIDSNDPNPDNIKSIADRTRLLRQAPSEYQSVEDAQTHLLKAYSCLGAEAAESTDLSTEITADTEVSDEVQTLLEFTGALDQLQSYYEAMMTEDAANSVHSSVADSSSDGQGKPSAVPSAVASVDAGADPSRASSVQGDPEAEDEANRADANAAVDKLANEGAAALPQGKPLTAANVEAHKTAGETSDSTKKPSAAEKFKKQQQNTLEYIAMFAVLPISQQNLINSHLEKLETSGTTPANIQEQAGELIDAFTQANQQPIDSKTIQQATANNPGFYFKMRECIMEQYMLAGYPDNFNDAFNKDVVEHLSNYLHQVAPYQHIDYETLDQMVTQQVQQVQKQARVLAFDQLLVAVDQEQQHQHANNPQRLQEMMPYRQRFFQNGQLTAAMRSRDSYRIIVGKLNVGLQITHDDISYLLYGHNDHVSDAQRHYTNALHKEITENLDMRQYLNATKGQVKIQHALKHVDSIAKEHVTSRHATDKTAHGQSSPTNPLEQMLQGGGGSSSGRKPFAPRSHNLPDSTATELSKRERLIRSRRSQGDDHADGAGPVIPTGGNRGS